MKRSLLLLAAAFAFFVTTAKAQTTASSTIEKKLTDSVCIILNKMDISKVSNKKEAVALYTEAISHHVDILQEWATAQGIEFTDAKAMEAIGIKLAQNLMKQNCANFMKLATKMSGADADEVATETTTGTFKRIDVKGFNYIVLTDGKGSERSFIWLRQFPGSEKFMGLTTKYAGKKLKISWQEMEVYLPAAKGYYKVKEIIGVEVL
ncbi:MULTISPECIES: hypothetical protein [unclassified Mucilaginibacter]|uniref:hypothetical protein n=1 Tax=unclassified Mucilaginibacter TaxID=2617802 RepID=UPI002AC9E702|nr:MULTISPECIES: hypothetical protein [unclassified Mucilaginibacter]MEB0260529.1 hypothetical protein [Mucilaginibacter sp. 10I4]MEB0278115.1 hypothetical protein [Mucilaginibacter sp. 10B2]MEB0301773.1 hypothetical protein [Mucilaginibacter sp. 5C4]WPX23027.1 hypothetical protein RHM67_17240 [Mucilaginibacter sp. 5C4]